MSTAKFDAVRELINEKNYEEARALLKTIDHPTAREWETQLNKVAPPPIASFMTEPAKTVQKRPNFRLGCIGLLLVIIFVLIFLTPDRPKPNQRLAAVSSPTSNISEVDATRVASAPIVFISATAGQQPVIGPLKLPTGLYRVTVQTNGFFIAKLEASSGTCDAGLAGLFNLGRGQGKGGASALLTSKECSALISISKVTDAWSMQFQRIDSSTPVITDLKYDNTANGMQPVLGPLSLPSGTYRARVVTSGFFVAHMDTVSGNCNEDFMGLFNLYAGQADKGAEVVVHSTDCVALISISNVSEPWTLEFQPIK